MAYTIPAHLLKVLKAHVGFELAVVYNNRAVVDFVLGTLTSFDEEQVVIKSFKEKINVGIGYLQGRRQKIYSIYNLNNIDLLEAEQVPSLYDKLSVKELKPEIIGRLKMVNNKEVTLICRTSEHFFLTKGKVSGFDLNSLVIKPAPFYNSEQRIAFRSVFNIFDMNHVDIIH